jgi:hypothetical protein
MRRKLSSVGIVLFLVLVAGCIGGPDSPLSTIPTILIDHIEDTQETKVYVQGIENTLFGNITIQINDGTLRENHTYSLHMSTKLNKFALNVTVWFKLKEYQYTGNITISEEDNEIELEILDDRHDNPIKRTPPYTIIMERRK